MKRVCLSVLSVLLGVGAMIEAVDAAKRMVPMAHPCTVVERHFQVKDAATDDFAYDCILDSRDSNGMEGMKVMITDENGNRHGRDFDCGGGGCISGVTQMFPTGDQFDVDNQIQIEIQDVMIESPGNANKEVPTKLWGPKNKNEGFVNNGQDPDLVNLSSQTEACSYGSSTIVPATGSIITDGVIDVSIDIGIGGEDLLTVANAVTVELASLLNSATPQLDTSFYDHVMYCLPPTPNSNWIAFAYLNDNLSVYNNENCGYVSVQMHEIGHNLGLTHSGNRGSNYGDRIGYMGLSYGFDDTPRMCFNAPKSWQLGWYGSSGTYGNKVVDLGDITSGVNQYSWSGTLVGISEYADAAAGQNVIVKIGRVSSEEDLFVAFNRASGINSQTQIMQDRVVVSAQTEGGVSNTLAELTIGQSYIENDFDGNSGLNFAITAADIDFSVTPWTASITIEFGAGVEGFDFAVTPTNLTMDERWKIDEPLFQYDDLFFELDFNVSDYVNNDQVDFEIYEESDCETPVSYGDYAGAEDAALYTLLPTQRVASPNNIKSGAFFVRETIQNAAYYAFGAGTKTFSLGLGLNPKAIEQDAQVFFAADSDTERTATAKFCVRFKLLTADQKYEVNYLDTLVYLDLNLTDGFVIDVVSVEPKDKLVETADQAYGVEGYLCDNDNTPVTGQTKSQGELLRVCVEPNADAVADGVFMRSIDSFAWSRGGTVTQTAIVDREPADNQLTTYFPDQCKGSGVCWFESLLFASFFTSAGVVSGSGIASMQFGDANRRRLLRSDRTLQDDDVAASAEFEMEIDVEQGTLYFASDASRANVMFGMSLLTATYISLIGS